MLNLLGKWLKHQITQKVFLNIPILKLGNSFYSDFVDSV